VSTCSSCGAEVAWTRTRTGKRMPLDPHPRADGNVIVDVATDTAIVLAPGTPMPVGVPRFTSHFATCPHADQHRRTR
jgi:hypothetical protein